ncbi:MULTISPECIES: IclR family transcriptional regulator [Rhizobium/Agrobacterium group]|uniref:IclR family transcriptional regulator n=2 Tax=Rhizobium/Agrobacterium group TaxID=227290 RepID=A0A9X3KSJ2_9HYPH|nr:MULTISPECIES: IclR family transcriptional regulator [Rhizobium/Agrobacterium group]MCZ7466774.1 IclR family transcriptional regulator [Rhizobium rhizogenes]MCZ7939196.1 IclR family transcriptional regulator [Agrobacterium salinitolerans]TRA86241.1 IclR family transcriptional regulator [Agrobacterium salinitolerans]TRA96347.1 IclR family transcriptional regulator [Rhizobium rhizogenes]
MSESSNHSIYFVPGLHRGLRVLEILGEAGKPMSLSEISQVMKLSRSSVFRLIYTLRQMGFLKEAEQANSYTLGARVLNLGFAYLNQLPITTIARPHLSALRDKTGVSAHLSVLEGHDVLYLGSHQARTGFVSNMVTGTRTAAYASAIGWCLLVSLSDDELEAFCEGQEMTAYTEHTPTNAAALKSRVDQVRAQGFIVSRGFREPGGSSVAVPVRDNSGKVAACINISGPDTGFDFDRLDSFYIPETRATALQISREMGYGGPG